MNLYVINVEQIGKHRQKNEVNIMDKNTEKNKDHLIVRHLVAMDYAKEGLEKKLSKMPHSNQLEKKNQKELRKIISELRGIINWYQLIIETHKEKALSHIPETEKTKRAKENRTLENESYINLFLNDGNQKLDIGKMEEFKRATDDFD